MMTGTPQPDPLNVSLQNHLVLPDSQLIVRNGFHLADA